MAAPSPMNRYQHLFDYDKNVNLQLLDLAISQDVKGRVQQVFAHMSIALSAWYFRVIQEEKQITIWPEQNLAETRGKFEQVYRNWDEFLSRLNESDTERTVSYTNSKGQHYISAIGDILDHLLLHGAYHRGQINLLFRQQDIEPLAIDYIFLQRAT